MIDGMGRGGPLWGLRAPDAGSKPGQIGTATRPAPDRGAVDKSNGGRLAVVRDMAASPPVDGSRVAALRAEIAAGRFRTDPLAIADAMMKLEPRKP